MTYTSIQLKPFVAKRGRPYSQTTIKAKKLIQKHPHITPKELARILKIKKKPTTKSKDQFDYTRHARVILHRYNINKLNINNNNNKHRQNNISQLLQHDIYYVLYDYIQHKQAQNKPFFDALRSVSKNRYINHCGVPEWRYDSDMILEVTDHNYRLREPIRRLRNRETYIMRNHRHKHNGKEQIIKFHVGDHNLVKFLCNDNFLNIPYKSRIFFGKGHFISTDASGLDICHLECFKRLLDVNIRTQLGGTALLEACFKHGKLMVKNEIKQVW